MRIGCAQWSYVRCLFNSSLPGDNPMTDRIARSQAHAPETCTRAALTDKAGVAGQAADGHIAAGRWIAPRQNRRNGPDHPMLIRR
jgi:hypothetical protein